MPETAPQPPELSLPSAPWDRLSAIVGDTGAEMLRRFRVAVIEAFPGHLRAAVRYGSHARGDGDAGTLWHVAIFIDSLDPDVENRRLHLLAVPFQIAGFPLSPLGLPVDRRGVSPELLATISRDGIPVLGAHGMTFEGFTYWQRRESDLHDLVNGQPVRMSATEQESRRAARALLAATTGFGGDYLAARQFLERQHSGLGAVALELAAKDWRGLVKVLRMLEDFFPDCAAHDPDTALFGLGCYENNLLAEAERFAALEAGR